MLRIGIGDIVISLVSTLSLLIISRDS